MAGFTELIPVGKKFVSKGRTITEGDFSLLTSLTWTVGEIHTNREYMKKTQFGEMILAGPCILACAVGLASTSGLRAAMEQDGLRTVALLGFEDVRFRSPLKPGDTMVVHSEILDIRPTSKNPKRGVMRVREVTFNQRGEAVMEATRAAMLELTR